MGLSADLILQVFHLAWKTAFDRMSRYLIDPDHILELGYHLFWSGC